MACSGLFTKVPVLLAIAVIYGLNLADFWIARSGTENPAAVQPTSNPTAGNIQPLFEERFVNRIGETPRVHAPTATINADGELYSYWYGGSIEGAVDVSIYGARFDPQTNNWTDQHKILSAASATTDTGYWVRKVGNPVAFTHPDGRVWLFYVNVTIGGWALSTINLATSTDGGQSFADGRRLVTSPFFNRSTLVKTPAINFADGSVGLPVHHQMLTKHGELLFLNQQGDVVDKRRIPSKHPGLQPAIAALSDGTLVAFMRSSVGKILRSTSRNQGQDWSDAVTVDVANPDSAVAVATTPTGLLLAFNDDTKNRDILSLAHSMDGGKNWRKFFVLEHQPNLHEHDHTNEFSYPWFLKDEMGNFHLFYTWQRTSIKHVNFNFAWLERELRNGSDV